jgi:hypothetical protein
MDAWIIDPTSWQGAVTNNVAARLGPMATEFDFEHIVSCEGGIALPLTDRKKTRKRITSMLKR